MVRDEVLKSHSYKQRFPDQYCCHFGNPGNGATQLARFEKEEGI